MIVGPAGMDSPTPSLTPSATGVDFLPLETTQAPPPLPKKSLGMKKTHTRVQAPPPTTPMVFGVATTSPTTRRTYRRQTCSKADGGGLTLAEGAAKKKMKKAKVVPRPRPAPRLATLVAPAVTAPARAAAAVGNKSRGHQVLDEMSTSSKMNTAEFIASLESLSTVGLDELNYDSLVERSSKPLYGKLVVAEGVVLMVVAEEVVLMVLADGVMEVMMLVVVAERMAVVMVVDRMVKLISLPTTSFQWWWPRRWRCMPNVGSIHNIYMLYVW
ncbi:hypothetical protein VPH35_037472 [Triticum aestivum]